MILTVVRFPTSAELDAQQTRDLIARTAPRYHDVPGLRRKWFVAAPGEGGGIYEWSSRAAAEAWFDAAWRERMRAAYGAEPSIDWFESHALVDNVAGRIET
jgi:hypothetical protein